MLPTLLPFSFLLGLSHVAMPARRSKKRQQDDRTATTTTSKKANPLAS